MICSPSPREQRVRVRRVLREAIVRDKTTGCWTWLWFCEGNGYPRLQWGGPRRAGSEQYAHRIVFRAFFGEIPEGLEIDHLCRDRSCVNPRHLELVTRLENVQRGGNSIKTVCHRGHPLTPDNVRMEGRSRRCVQCKKEYDLVYKSQR